MLDCQLFGLNAGGHHFTNVLLHTIAVLLLFLVFHQMTGAFWQSAFVASLFAIHPLHVESVAWISDAKTDLSAVIFHAYSLGVPALCARAIGRTLCSCGVLPGSRTDVETDARDIALRTLASGLLATP